jgi:chorismate synthase
MTIENRDFASWTDRMAPEPLPKPPEPLTRPRPGHADLAGGLKFDRDDLRDILERASARETAARTAVGAVARKLLGELDIQIFAHVVAIGGVRVELGGLSHAAIRERARASDLSCADADAEKRMREAILEAAHAGDTLGGVLGLTTMPLGPGRKSPFRSCLGA